MYVMSLQGYEATEGAFQRYFKKIGCQNFDTL